MQQDVAATPATTGAPANDVVAQLTDALDSQITMSTSGQGKLWLVCVC